MELMLANLVAEKYTSIYEVDWFEMARSSNQSINQSIKYDLAGPPRSFPGTPTPAFGAST